RSWSSSFSSLDRPSGVSKTSLSAIRRLLSFITSACFAQRANGQAARVVIFSYMSLCDHKIITKHCPKRVSACPKLYALLGSGDDYIPALQRMSTLDGA